MVIIKYIKEHVYYLRFFTVAKIFILPIVFITSSCSNNNDLNEEQIGAPTGTLGKTDSILPPVTVLITNPDTACVKGCPPPNIISLPRIPNNQAPTLQNGEIQKLLPPEKKTAILLSNYQNYNTSNGLCSDAINCSIIDKMGNLWLGSAFDGVIRYDGKTFTNFTKQNGLPSNEIRSIMEDKLGNIWLGTNGGGLSRYDGKSFTNFSTAQGLGNNSVLAILEDKSGDIWLGTSGGISRYNSQTNRIKYGKLFKNFIMFQNNIVSDIIEDKKGNLWFASDRSGVAKYDGKRFSNYTNAHGLSSNSIRCIYEDKSGAIWFGSYNGVSRYKPQPDSIFQPKSIANYTVEQGLVDNRVKKIMEDKMGILWFATAGGLSSYNPMSAGDKGVMFSNFTSAQGLANNSVSSISVDKSNNLWFGTNGSGVSRFEGNALKNFTTSQGLGNNKIRSIMQDKSRNLWFGGGYGGASCYNGISFTNYSKDQGISISNAVFSIIEDKKGNLWFGTYNKGVSRYDGKCFTNYSKAQGLVHDVVLCMIEDKKGNLWFGTSGGGISCYNGKFFTNYNIEQGLVNNIILCITEDKKGNIWFGTYQGGVSCYDGKSFINYTTAQGLPSNVISSITEDKMGNLWFSGDNGLARYDGESFINYTMSDGLPDKLIAQIVLTHEEYIALGTNNGLAMLVGFSPLSSQKNNSIDIVEAQNSLTNKQLRNYSPIFEIYNPSTGYAIKNTNIGQNAMYKDSQGILWIGTGADRIGLVRFDYSQVNKKNELPKVFIQGIKINDENICWYDLNQRNSSQIKNNHSKNYTDSLSLLPVINEEILTQGRVLTDAERKTMLSKYKDIQFDSIRKFYPVPENLVLPHELNNITFDFAAIEPAKPELIRYKYKLENYDKEWSSATNKTTVTFGNINEGVYTFKLKAQKIGVNAGGSDSWSEPITYAFKVLPPWWRTWWMYSVYGVLAITFIVFIVWWNGRRLRARAKVLSEEVRIATFTIVQQKKMVEEKHKEITDSINYAERIQRALLASKKILDENLSNYFIFFKPKDVVSGDFYWATKLDNNNFVLVTADSTGHGVPGAIMSILNIACLDKAVTKSIMSPELILNETRRLVIEYLKNDGSREGGKDGMDGSLLSFDFKNSKLYCASAYNPIWIIRGVELIEIKADRMPIGKSDKDNTPFTLQTFILQKGDIVYTLTDGFADQFGGMSGKKFKYKQLQELLLSISNETMEIQKQKLNETFDNWKGSLEQIDDVCLIGIRI